MASRANFTSLATPDAVGSGKTALVTLLHEGGHAAHFANITQYSPLFSQVGGSGSMGVCRCESGVSRGVWVGRRSCGCNKGYDGWRYCTILPGLCAPLLPPTYLQWVASALAQERAPTSVAYAENQSMFLDSLAGDADWLGRYAKSRWGPWLVAPAAGRTTGLQACGRSCLQRDWAGVQFSVLGGQR